MSTVSLSRTVRNRAIAVCSAFSLLLASAAAALEVDRAELEKGGMERIVFINYEGPHARIDSAEDILGIGIELGRAVRNGAARAGDARRYYAIHSISPASDGAALDADVIGLGVDAGVDHIRNLRLILRGFLQAAYDYSSKDAALLAEFASVYNAVHRGDWNYYATRYKTEVAASLAKEKVGLSVRFDEWPGRAMIVIPLSQGAKAGSISAVDTTPLTEKKVVDELRKKEDLGIESRKEMVDLKEREAAEAKQKAELAREAIVDEEKKIAEEKAAIQEEKALLAAARDELRKEEEAAEKQTAPEAAGERAATETAQAAAEKSAAETALAEKEAAVAEKEKEVAEKEAALDEKKEEAAKSEALAEKKETEAVAERADIAKDQQEQIKKEDAAVVQPKGELSLKMVSSDGPFARFVLLDLATGKELKASALDTVRSRSVAEAAGRLVAVAGRTGGNAAVRLVLVDKTSLEMISQGEDDIHPDSPVWVNGENLYALSVVSGSIKLDSFGADLKRKAQSAATLHPYAALRFAPGTVLTQGADGSPLMLKDTDLSTISR